METIQAYVALIKDIITGLSAATAAIIAIMGLQTWKKQLRGKTEYELAQRMAKATYKVREAVAGFRNPLSVGIEIQQAMDEANSDQTNDPNLHARSAQSAYNKLWQTVQEAFVDLEAVSLEAEAIWGESVTENLKPLKRCAATLFEHRQAYLQNLLKPSYSPGKEVENQILEVIYGWPGNPENNPFSNEITEA